jgi:hypothetical protein
MEMKSKEKGQIESLQIWTAETTSVGKKLGKVRGKEKIK